MVRRFLLLRQSSFLSCVALGLAAGALAQTGGSGNASGAGNSPSAPAPASTNSSSSTPKKVWTNEELPSGQGGVSVVGKKGSNAGGASKQTANATADGFRRNIEKLQSQLDDVNSKLKTYKEFLEGEPVSTNAREWNKGVNRTPVDQQIVQLQDKKKKLETQISDLYDEARKRGIDSNQLP